MSRLALDNKHYLHLTLVAALAGVLAATLFLGSGDTFVPDQPATSAAPHAEDAAIDGTHSAHADGDLHHNVTDDPEPMVTPIGRDAEATDLVARNEASSAKIEPVFLEGAERAALLDMRLTEEPPDAQWSARHEQTLSDAVSRADLAGIDLYSTVCRSTFCRMDLHAGNQDELESLLLRLLDLAEQASGTTELHGVEELGSGLAARIYVSRDGFELPVM